MQFKRIDEAYYNDDDFFDDEEVKTSDEDDIVSDKDKIYQYYLYLVIYDTQPMYVNKGEYFLKRLKYMFENTDIAEAGDYYSELEKKNVYFYMPFTPYINNYDDLRKFVLTLANLTKTSFGTFRLYEIYLRDFSTKKIISTEHTAGEFTPTLKDINFPSTEENTNLKKMQAFFELYVDLLVSDPNSITDDMVYGLIQPDFLKKAERINKKIFPEINNYKYKSTDLRRIISLTKHFSPKAFIDFAKKDRTEEFKCYFFDTVVFKTGIFNDFKYTEADCPKDNIYDILHKDEKFTSFAKYLDKCARTNKYIQALPIQMDTFNMYDEDNKRVATIFSYTMPFMYNKKTDTVHAYTIILSFKDAQYKTIQKEIFGMFDKDPAELLYEN